MRGFLTFLFWSSAAIASEPSLNFEALRSLIFSSNAKSIEQAVPLIGQRYPDYSRFYTLMYASESLHETTFEKPRVIMFGRDAKFILTFNGDSRWRSGNAFETLEFSEATRNFIFREITFKTATYDPNESLALKPSEIEFENNNLVISKPNPHKCLQCHGSAATPLWGSSSIWAGAYGSVANNLYLSFSPHERRPIDAKMWERATKPLSQGTPLFLRQGVADLEAEGMIRYLQTKSSNERYRWLPDHVSAKGFLRFANGETLATLDMTAEYRQEQERANVGKDWPSRPNRFFQLRLMKLNNLRILDEIKRAGLERGVYATADWASLEDAALQRDGIHTIEQASVQIMQAISPVKAMKPGKMQIAAALQRNLYDEMDAQFMKIVTHDMNFGEHAFEFHAQESRPNMGWIGDPVAFYFSLLQIKKASDAEQVAMVTETGNQVVVTALSTLLAQYGIDLHKYSMNLNRKGLNFYSGGLADVAEYLGIPKSENF